MAIYLKVSFEDKDIAKAAGAKWNAGRKQWFYPGDNLPEALKKFLCAATQSANSVLRCRSCGQTGRRGGYPFSTLPGSGRCDDCI